MSAPYCSFEDKRKEYRYQRPVPKALHALMGSKCERKWLGPDKKGAEIEARSLAHYHDGLFANLASMSADEKTELMKHGGVAGARRKAALAPFAEMLATFQGPNPREAASRLALLNLPTRDITTKPIPATSITDLVVPRPQTPSRRRVVAVHEGLSLATVAGQALWQDDTRRALAKAHADFASARPFAFERTISTIEPEYTWDGLFELWKRKTDPKRTEQHPHTLRLLKEILGEMDYREVTPQHIDKFIKGMDERGISKPMQVKIRERVSGMFSAAVPLVIPFNPCKGVTIDGKVEKTKVRPFSGEQERAILATATKTRYGGKRHTEAMWLLHLEAFMGCRIREPSQLQCGDVGVESGVPVIHFRQECAETGRKHPEKSIKTDEERTMPLHPALWDKKHPRYVGADFRKFAKGDAGKFIFAAFEYSGDARGRADWMIQNGGKLLKAAGVTGPKRAYAPNHSFRHRWNDAARNADWPKDFREAFMGEAKGINAKYGGKILVKMAGMLRDVDPLADV